MEKQKFINIIKNPYDLDDNTLLFLKEVSEQYPYCQTAQILLAKNIELFDKLEYERHVNKATVYSVDRNRFLRYISEKEEPVKPPQKVTIEEKQHKQYYLLEDHKKLSKEELEHIVNTRLFEIQEEKKKAQISGNTNSNVKMFMVDDLLEHSSVSTDNYQRNTHSDNIIDKFIKDDPRIITPKDASGEIDHSQSSVMENDDIISETIAEIYYKQGKPEKAIEVYNKLSLKFPEKSSYFAQRINDITKDNY